VKPNTIQAPHLTNGSTRSREMMRGK